MCSKYELMILRYHVSFNQSFCECLQIPLIFGNFPPHLVAIGLTLSELYSINVTFIMYNVHYNCNNHIQKDIIVIFVDVIALYADWI